MDGLIHALGLDGQGGARALAWEDVENWRANRGWVWLHFDYTETGPQQWLTEDSGVPAVVADALLTLETRPRASVIGQGLLVYLRGVNMHPGAEPDDMIALRAWVEDRRIITTRKRELMSVQDILAELERGEGPADVGGLLARISDLLTWRMEDAIAQLEERVQQYEQQSLRVISDSLRGDLAEVRRNIISLRRFMAPQREAFTRMQADNLPWFSDGDRLLIREAGDRLQRLIEQLDAAREHASITQEDLAMRVTERLNKRLYLLAAITGLFLPLGFLTGLFGVNLGGMPGAQSPDAFPLFAGILVLTAIGGALFMRFNRWL